MRNTLQKNVRQSTVVTVCVTLFFLAAVAQTIVLIVIPIQLYRLIGEAQTVSIIYGFVGLTSFVGRLWMPSLIRLLSQSGVLASGNIALLGAAALFSTETISGSVIGLLVHTLALASLEIVLTLYVLDHIPRTLVARFETRRLFFVGFPWTFAALVGVYLRLHFAPWTPFLVESLAAIILWWYFRFQQSNELLTDHSFVNSSPRTVRHHVSRFISQPRLRLAWIVAAGRASWWNMFYVFAPIFAVASDLGEEAAGFITSAGTLGLSSVLLWKQISRRIGIRHLLILGCIASAYFTTSAGFLLHLPPVAGVLLVLAALATSSIDSAGNALFLRAVHSYERSTMTSIYVSYRDFAQLGPPVLFSLLLSAFSLPAVFIGGGAMMLLLMISTLYIPRQF